MKTSFTTKQKLCLVLCVLTVLNALCLTQLHKTHLKTKAVCDLTDQYEVDILEMEDSNRKTLETRLLTMDAFVEAAREIFDKEAFPEGVSAMLAYDGDNMGKKAEQYGRNEVNKLMVAFADVTKQHFPENDKNIVCNVGEKSDEFYVLLLGSSFRGISDPGSRGLPAGYPANPDSDGKRRGTDRKCQYRHCILPSG